MTLMSTTGYAADGVGVCGTIATLTHLFIDNRPIDPRSPLRRCRFSKYPMVRIHPADFEAARQFAERAHAMRLASLYVNAKADLSDFPPESFATPISRRATKATAPRLPG